MTVRMHEEPQPTDAGRVLLVEDDTAIADGLARALRSQGYAVAVASTAADALAAGGVSPPDLVLLDLGLPDADGVDVCRRLRRDHPSLPIVILTARTDEVDVVVGLDAGANDYVSKPFRLAELLARVRAHLRHVSALGEPRRVASAGNVVLDFDAHRAFVDGEEVELRRKEFELLSLLVAEPGQLLTRERIMREVWDDNWWGSTKTLDMHISALRRKITPPERDARVSITTIRGVGFRLDVEPERE
jgi:DNA-binding response OmpR family regulator